MKRALTFVALLALVCAGFAAAGGLTKIMLKPGKCVTVAKVKVCAAKAKPTVIVKTVQQPAVTVTAPAQTVTVTTTVAAPPPPPPPPPTSRVSMDFYSTGSTLTVEPSFTTYVDETVTWTCTWPSGAVIGKPNGDLYISDWGSPSGILLDAYNTPSGSFTLRAGTHIFHIISEASATWTVHVR